MTATTAAISTPTRSASPHISVSGDGTEGNPLIPRIIMTDGTTDVVIDPYVNAVPVIQIAHQQT